MLPVVKVSQGRCLLRPLSGLQKRRPLGVPWVSECASPLVRAPVRPDESHALPRVHALENRRPQLRRMNLGGTVQLPAGETLHPQAEEKEGAMLEPPGLPWPHERTDRPLARSPSDFSTLPLHHATCLRVLTAPKILPSPL